MTTTLLMPAFADKARRARPGVGVSTSVNTTGGLGETWFGAMRTPPLCRRCHHLIAWSEVHAGTAGGVTYFDQS